MAVSCFCAYIGSYYCVVQVLLLESAELWQQEPGVGSEPEIPANPVQDFKWKLFQTGVPSAFTLESES